jgi:hypothetical protein
MNKIKIVFMLFVLVLFSLPGFLSFGIRYLPANNQPPLELTQKLYEDKVVEDSLTISSDNFTGVGLSFKNPNLINKKDISLKVSEVGGDTVRIAVLSGSIIPDGGFVRFTFEPITGSKGQEYALTLSSPSSREGEALEVYLSAGADNFASVVYYKPTSAASLIGDVYSNWLGRFFGDEVFAVFYLVLIASGLGFVAFGKKETI